MNKYLEKIALRRSVVEFAKGTLSKSLPELSQLGVIKPKKVYLEGMKRGNLALAQKNNTVIQEAKNPGARMLAGMGGGYTTAPPNKNNVIRILTDKNGPLNADKMSHQGLIRHEIIEANSLRRRNASTVPFHRDITQDLHSLGVSAKDSRKMNREVHRHITPFSVIKVEDNIVGSHFTPSVLSRESEEVRKNPYIKDVFTNLRNMSSEKSWVENTTGKRYGVDKMGKSSNKKMDRLQPTSSLPDPSGVEVSHKVYQLK